jgi:hypothetical protein
VADTRLKPGNTNADADDEPPGNVDDTDEVLWISVSGGFTGKTTRNIVSGPLARMSSSG